MFILPNKQQSVGQLFINTFALFKLSFSRLLPFAIIAAILTDTPAISEQLWHHDILKTPGLFWAFFLVEQFILIYFFAFLQHQTWGLMHNRERRIEASTLYIGARFFRVLGIHLTLFAIFMAVFFITLLITYIASHLMAGNTQADSQVALYYVYVTVKAVIAVYLILRLMLVSTTLILKNETITHSLKLGWAKSRGHLWKITLVMGGIAILTVPVHMFLLHLAHVDNSVLDVVADILVTSVMYILANAGLMVLFYDTELSKA